MKNLKLILAIFTIAAMIVSCEKEGSQGPPGPKGEQGEQGKDGVPGKDGEDGNANVISLSVTFPKSSLSSTGGPYRLNITGPNTTKYLTQDILNTGVILCYHKRWAGTVRLLDYFHSINGRVVNYRGTAYKGKYEIYINSFTSQGGEVEKGDVTANLNFRLVIIPSSIQKKGWDIDFENYGEVKEAFGLDDF